MTFLLFKGLSRVFSNTSIKASVLQHSAFFTIQLSHLYMTTGKTIVLTIRTLKINKNFKTMIKNHENMKFKKNVKVKVTQSCPTLCNPMDYIVHGILQARILDWVAVLFSRGIFPTQGSNPGLSHCRWTLPAEPQGQPKGKKCESESEVTQ